MESFAEHSRTGEHDSAGERLRVPLLSHPADVDRAAEAIAAGAVVASGFGNVYALIGRSDPLTLRAINVSRGRPAEQVGSVTTTPDLTPLLFDWSRMPIGLAPRTVLGLMDGLLELGPFGFRGPAAPHVGPHLSVLDAGIRTTQVISPGRACPANALLARAIDRVEDDFLSVTSIDPARGPEESDDLPVLRHGDEAALRGRYPRHTRASATVLSFHRLGAGNGGRPCLTIERHGSLAVGEVQSVLERFGLGVVIAAAAERRQPRRPRSLGGIL